MTDRTTGERAGRVGLFEINAHENDLISLARIAREAGFAVTIFTSEAVRDRIGDGLAADNYEWIVKDEPLGAFLSRVAARCRSLDLLYSLPYNGSVSEFVHYARFEPPCPLVLSIFNTNSWLPRNLRFTPKLYNYARIPLRRLILRRVNAVSVEYDPIREYLGPRVQTPVHTMTPVLYDGRAPAERNGPLRVTVPGNVVASRRRYDLLFDALAALPPKLRDDFALTLLGRPMDHTSDRILARADDFADRGWDVTYHEEWIPPAEFEAALERSDVLLSPLCRTKAHGVATEVYGQTKSSGVLGDAVRTATPLILPDSFAVPRQFADATATFADAADLAGTLRTFVGDRLDELRRGAQRTAQHYSLDAQSERFRILVDSVTDSGV